MGNKKYKDHDIWLETVVGSRRMLAYFVSEHVRPLQNPSMDLLTISSTKLTYKKNYRQKVLTIMELPYELNPKSKGK